MCAACLSRATTGSLWNHLGRGLAAPHTMAGRSSCALRAQQRGLVPTPRRDATQAVLGALRPGGVLFIIGTFASSTRVMRSQYSSVPPMHAGSGLSFATGLLGEQRRVPSLPTPGQASPSMLDARFQDGGICLLLVAAGRAHPSSA